MALLFANNASATLANTLTVGTLSAVLSSGQGALFPTPTGGDTFYATLENAAGNIEVVSCTARSADTITIVRAREETTDQEFIAGSRFEMRLTAAVLNALLQSSIAATVYTPLTHFNTSGVTAQTLHNGAIAEQTTVQGKKVRRAAGQTETSVSLRTSADVQEGALLTNSTGEMMVYNLQNNGNVRLRATNTGGTPVDILVGLPGSATTRYHAGVAKDRTTSYGLDVLGAGSLAPYNSRVALFTNNGTTELGTIGFVGATNEFRINSYANSYPIGLFANNSGGTLVVIAQGLADGAFNQYFAGAKKAETTATGFAVTGVATQTTAPTAADHLARKDYVDAQVATAASPASSLAVNGYYRHANGFTEMWGTTSASLNAFGVTFPIPFTTCFNVVVTENAAGLLNSQLEHNAQIINLTASGFTINKPNDYSAGYYWRAYGVI